MTIPSGTIRTQTEIRLGLCLDRLPRFALKPHGNEEWMVTTWMGKQPEHRRHVIIGRARGPLDPDGIASNTGPTTDSWTISCGIGRTDETDPIKAKQSVEDTLNAIMDMLAADHRLTYPGAPDIGCHSLRVVDFVGPFYSWEGDAPLAWAEFDISASANIRRQPPSL